MIKIAYCILFSIFLTAAFLQGEPNSGFSLPVKKLKGQTIINSDQITLESSDFLSQFTFTGNVEIHGNNLYVSCEKMYVISRRSGDKEATVGEIGNINSVIALGNVRIEQGDRVAMAGRAEILPREDKVILEDSPTVIDGGSTVRGHRMILLKGERKAIVEGAEGERPTVTLPMIEDLGF